MGGVAGEGRSKPAWAIVASSGTGGNLSRFNEAFAIFKLANNGRQQRFQPRAQRGIGAITDAQPDDSGTGTTTTHPFGKILVLRHNHGSLFLGMLPNDPVLALRQPDFQDMFSLMPPFTQPAGQRIRQLCVNNKAHGSSTHQHRIIHLLGSKFQTSANIIGFKKRIVFQDLRFADTRSQHIQDVFDANAIMADARPPAALLRIKCDSVGMFHDLKSNP